MRVLASLLIVGLLTATWLAPASAEGVWSGDFGPPPGGNGLDGQVLAATTFQENLVVGGDMFQGGSTSLSHCGMWNGVSWTPLGAGTDGAISAFCRYDDRLAAAGFFTQAGGQPANYVAIWDGSTWSPLGTGFDNYARALCTYEGDLIAGGAFTTADGSPAGYVARWDGSSWSAMGSLGNRVEALAVYDGALHGGGFFQDAGGQEVLRIARWNGTEWEAVGGGVSGPGARVRALRAFQGSLYAAGKFSIAGVDTVANVAVWDGASWAAVGSGLDGEVWSLGHYGPYLIAGGAFTASGSSPLSGIAVWDGSAWLPIGSGVDGTPYAFVPLDGSLFVGGTFADAGGEASSCLAQWTDEDTWGMAHRVSIDGMQDYVSVQSALDATAEDEDSVVVSAGSYQETLLCSEKDVSCHGASGAGSVAVRGAEFEGGVYSLTKLEIVGMSFIGDLSARGMMSAQEWGCGILKDCEIGGNLDLAIWNYNDWPSWIDGCTVAGSASIYQELTVLTIANSEFHSSIEARSEGLQIGNCVFSGGTCWFRGSEQGCGLGNCSFTGCELSISGFDTSLESCDLTGVTAEIVSDGWSSASSELRECTFLECDIDLRAWPTAEGFGETNLSECSFDGCNVGVESHAVTVVNSVLNGPGLLRIVSDTCFPASYCSNNDFFGMRLLLFGSGPINVSGNRFEGSESGLEVSGTFKDALSVSGNRFEACGESAIELIDVSFEGAGHSVISGNLMLQCGTAVRCRDTTVLIGSNTIAGCSVGGVVIGSSASNQVTLTRNTIAGNNTGVVVEDDIVEWLLECNNVWNNTGGNYLGLPDPTGVDGNFSADPLFCDPLNGDFHIAENSQCAPGNHPDGVDCGLIGALDVACPVGFENSYIVPGGGTIWSGLEFEVPVMVQSYEDLKGYSIHLQFDPAVLELQEIVHEGTIGEGAELEASSFTDSSATTGVIYSYACPPSIPAGEGIGLRLRFTVRGSAPEGWTSLDIRDAAPALNRMTDCDGASIVPALYDGDFFVRNIRFTRGDVNGDGVLDISDPIFSLAHQFMGGPGPGCAESEDADDSGEVNISDPIRLLGFMFAGGLAPASPFPECGVDPTGFDLGCDCFQPCGYPCGKDSRDGSVDVARSDLPCGGIADLALSGGTASDTLWAELSLHLTEPLVAVELPVAFDTTRMKYIGFSADPGVSGMKFLEAGPVSEGALAPPWEMAWDVAEKGSEPPQERLDELAGRIRIGLVSDFRLEVPISAGSHRLGRLAFALVGASPAHSGGVSLGDGLGITTDLREVQVSSRPDVSGLAGEGRLGQEESVSELSVLLENPYRPGSRIQLAIPSSAGEVRVEVFDSQGRLVRTLHEGLSATPNLQLVWDGRNEAGRDCGSSLYLLRATAGERTLSRRILLVD